MARWHEKRGELGKAMLRKGTQSYVDDVWFDQAVRLDKVELKRELRRLGIRVPVTLSKRSVRPSQTSFTELGVSLLSTIMSISPLSARKRTKCFLPASS